MPIEPTKVGDVGVALFAECNIDMGEPDAVSSVGLQYRIGPALMAAPNVSISDLSKISSLLAFQSERSPLFLLHF